MKTSNSLAAVSCLLFALAGPAQGQTMRVNIPFGFSMAERNLAAGKYFVSLDVPSHRIVVSNLAGEGISAIFLSSIIPPAGNSHAALVFNRYGEHYFLREVRTSGSSVNMPISNEERFIRRASVEKRGPKLALVRVTLQ